MEVVRNSEHRNDRGKNFMISGNRCLMKEQGDYTRLNLEAW